MNTDALIIGGAHQDSGIREAPATNDVHQSPGIRERDLQPQERFEDELIMDLEFDQFVAATSRPVPRAALSARATAGLWALRVFVVLVSLMVIYTFIHELH
jgi:hypothetical protein